MTNKDLPAEEAHWLLKEITEQKAEIERLRAALLDLYNGTAEYVYLNNLGDPHNTTPMRRASEVLGVAYPRSMRAAAEPSEVYEKIGVLRPDGEFTTYEGCDGEPVYIRRELRT